MLGHCGLLLNHLSSSTAWRCKKEEILGMVELSEVLVDIASGEVNHVSLMLTVCWMVHMCMLSLSSCCFLNRSLELIAAVERNRVTPSLVLK